MRIVDLICVPTRTGFFRDDQAAIRGGVDHDGFLYEGSPVTEGFERIREPGVSVSVMLVLSTGEIALGDCVEVQYAGAGGRARAMESESVVHEIDDVVRPLLVGHSIDTFRALAGAVDALSFEGRPLSAPVRYGVTQALLHATALSNRETMAEVVQREYETGIEIAPVPLYTQSGDDRYANVDKMILKEVDVLPHGLINEVATKLGADGEILAAYVAWVRDRVLLLRTRDDYMPRLHFDTYGTIGLAFGGDLEAIAEYLGTLAVAAAPFALRIEHPIDAGGREEQIEIFARLRRELSVRGIPVELVVDEWCNTLEDIRLFVEAGAADVIHVKMPDLGGINNTIEALLYVRAAGLAALCGGTCNETDVSARVSTHIGMACGVDQLLAKPGMGVDEGLMIVGNEMARVHALAARRTALSEVPR